MVTKTEMKMIMKTMKLLTLVLTLGLFLGFVSCDDSIETPKQGENILPERFSVDIPDPLTKGSTPQGRVSEGRLAEDIPQGNEVYESLGFFIALAEGSSELVEAIIQGVSTEGIDRVLSITYESDEDGRVKNLEVLESSTYNGVTYEYEMVITDADSEGNADGGKAMQIFWNRDPIQGVAILKPYNINRVDDAEAGDAVYRVEYSEVSDTYDAYMIVSISGIPLPNALEDPFAVDNLQMFVGKKGVFVDVYGNSNHPNAVFFNQDEEGFNWAFVASGIEDLDIGVAEVGLPPSNLDSDDRATILETYSIKQVWTNQILALWPDIGQDLIDQYLANTEAPGFFNENGFVQGGTSPGAEYDPLVDRIQDLAPYNPKSVSDLVIEFK